MIPNMPFFPKADATILRSKYIPPADRPQQVGPVFDIENAQTPIKLWHSDAGRIYPSKASNYEPATVPEEPIEPLHRYLHPVLAWNERTRLTMLWYLTRTIFTDDELLSRLEEKVRIAQETTGWEFALTGLLDIDTYTRLAATGLPLAILPRRESTCAHTINQSHGTMFILPNMLEDWRFRASPHVEYGGLRAYAGVPLRLDTELGNSVALGSLCVASNASEALLTPLQQMTLTRLADWIVADIVHSTRLNRQRERRRMSARILEAQAKSDDDDFDEIVLQVLRTTYPNVSVNLRLSETSTIEIEGLRPIPFADFQHGLWEDGELIEKFIAMSGHLMQTATQPVRVVAARCGDQSAGHFLSIASYDIRWVFDDIDSWFVEACANMLTRAWQGKLLREATRAREKLFREISHQLRTPIHGILGSVDLLAEELNSKSPFNVSTAVVANTADVVSPDPSDPFVYIDDIRASGKDLIGTINNIIALNRWAEVPVGDRQNTFHTFAELEAGLLAEVSKSLSIGLSMGASLVFHQDFPENCDGICIDIETFKNCLLPILVNALESATTGVVAVSFTSQANLGDLMVDVEDTGCGILPSDQQRIFSAYEKVDSHSTGLGLGLTLARKFAGLLSGTVSLIASEMGRGSHFRATFRAPGYGCSSGQVQRPAKKFDHLPLKFHNSEANSTGLTLCNQFAKLLLSRGFQSSDSPQGALIITNHMEDSKLSSKCPQHLPADQAVICLIPFSTSTDGLEGNEDNILHIRAPLSKSMLDAALDKADIIVAKIAARKRDHLLTEPLASSELLTQVNALSVQDLQPVDEANSQVSRISIETSVDPIPVGDDAFPTVPAEQFSCASGALSLPIAKSIDIDLPRPKSSLSHSVLLVDDNAINLRILQLYCQKRKLKYHCAMDGQQAVDIFFTRQSSTLTEKTSPIDLVLMDLQMPVCDGLEATRQMRSLEKQNGWPRCLLFIVTGQDGARDRIDAENAGADGFFVKPLSIGLLDQTLKQHFPAFSGT